MWWIKHKPTGNIVVINKRTGRAQLGAEYVLGYLTQSNAINAIKQHGLMQAEGWQWEDLELVNGLGYTMDEIRAYAVQEGRYALRHREGWYWMNPSTRRVWYAKPDRAETAFKLVEPAEASVQNRAIRRLAGKRNAGFFMVRGLADGQVEVLENWFM